MKIPRPSVIELFCWFFILIGAMSMFSSLLPFFSAHMDTYVSKSLHRSKEVVLAYALIRNGVMILAAIGLLKRLPWSRVLFVVYFLLAMIFNYVLFRQFSWVFSIMAIVFIVFLYLPVTTNYLHVTDGSDGSSSDSDNAKTGPQ